jgi:hypothetical protein
MVRGNDSASTLGVCALSGATLRCGFADFAGQDPSGDKAAQDVYLYVL